MEHTKQYAKPSRQAAGPRNDISCSLLGSSATWYETTNHEANKIFETERGEVKINGDYRFARKKRTKPLRGILHKEKYSIEVLNVNSD